uniref:Cytochrome P450 n=1 Tax=Anopheles atroparvus TaxID=41427 RepID=A0AAG5CPL7_ANOAO
MGCNSGMIKPTAPRVTNRRARKNPVLIKMLLVKDVKMFMDRDVFNNVTDVSLPGHFFGLEGQPWHELRQTLTPTFTSEHDDMIWDEARELEQHMDQYHRQAEMEMKDVLRHSTTDVTTKKPQSVQALDLI